MFFPIWMSLVLIDDEYIEATRDLGGSYFDLVKDILLPLAAPGIIAGFIFIGHPARELDDRPRPSVADVARRWVPPEL